MPTVKIVGNENEKLLNNVRIMFKDPETGAIPDYTSAIIRSLQYVSDNHYQEQGADTRKSEVSEVI